MRIDLLVRRAHQGPETALEEIDEIVERAWLAREVGEVRLDLLLWVADLGHDDVGLVQKQDERRLDEPCGSAVVHFELDITYTVS